MPMVFMVMRVTVTLSVFFVLNLFRFTLCMGMRVPVIFIYTMISEQGYGLFSFYVIYLVKCLTCITHC